MSRPISRSEDRPSGFQPLSAPRSLTQQLFTRLAADRVSAAALKKIVDCFDAIDAAIERGEMAVDQDFAFHCAIADATGNPQFRRFLEYLGRFIIPRQTIWGRSAPVLSRTHLDMFQKEHRQILQAIRNRRRGR